jgi:sterol desaturase/sphingolipid hydroxylase (fatty acid hydroxylase superfamily)
MISFDCILVLTAQFQHSSMRAPEWYERVCRVIVVSPSMRRIHHSMVIRERDINYVTILSIWNRIFGTLLRNVAQEKIVIGLGPYRSSGRLNMWCLLRMPFTDPSNDICHYSGF